MSDQTACALLVGGNSSRMGVDKSLIVCEPNADPLYKTQLEKLRRVSSLPILLSVRPGQEFPDPGDNVEMVTDSAIDSGPLAGLASCLERTTVDWLLVLAVDMARMTTTFLNGIVLEAKTTGCGIVPRINGRWEPLAAVYPRRLLQKTQQHLADGKLSLQKFIDDAVADGLLLAYEVTGREKSLFSNLNTPEDLESLRHDEFIPTDLHRWEKQPGTKGKPQFTSSPKSDLVAVEDPLELRVEGRGIAVLMRTPGHDRELAAGFLFAENVIHHADDIFEISECQNLPPGAGGNPGGNVVDVLLRKGVTPNLEQLSRHVFTSSSCGVCGKTTIDSVFQALQPLPDDSVTITAAKLLNLPSALREKQRSFGHTGGQHACALFSPDGELQTIREDVGRHNALDKTIGHALLNQSTPLSSSILLLSGRISFELMQKALAAGIPFVAGISAPSSLAIEFARGSGQTLVGFLRKGGFNVYAGNERIDP
jgi:FdhD protein